MFCSTHPEWPKIFWYCFKLCWFSTRLAGKPVFGYIKTKSWITLKLEKNTMRKCRVSEVFRGTDRQKEQKIQNKFYLNSLICFTLQSSVCVCVCVMKQDENKIISMLCTHSIIAILIQFTVIINGAVQCVTVIFVPTRPEPAACCSLHFYVHLLKLWFVMSLHWIAWIHIIVSASSAFNGLCSKSVEGKAIYRLFTKKHFSPAVLPVG